MEEDKCTSVLGSKVRAQKCVEFLSNNNNNTHARTHLLAAMIMVTNNGKLKGRESSKPERIN